MVSGAVTSVQSPPGHKGHHLVLGGHSFIQAQGKNFGNLREMGDRETATCLGKGIGEERKRN